MTTAATVSSRYHNALQGNLRQPETTRAHYPKPGKLSEVISGSGLQGMADHGFLQGGFTLKSSRVQREPPDADYFARPYLAMKLALPSELALIIKPVNAAVASAGTSSLSVFKA